LDQRMLGIGTGGEAARAGLHRGVVVVDVAAVGEEGVHRVNGPEAGMAERPVILAVVMPLQGGVTAICTRSCGAGHRSACVAVNDVFRHAV
ncbi:hypothetical protein, partial [Parvimonas sp. M13]|uniref:hypothetical protein n=1 Tax=Parvimonas sp. M13 TaxID=3110694 RepID=UPI002B49DFA1